MALTILSHNVFWFQGVPFEPPMPGDPDPAVLARLVELYRRVPPDVACLQEVQSDLAFNAIKDALDMDGAYCPGCTHAQYGGALLWRSGRPGPDAQTLASPPQRMWQTATAHGAIEPLVIANLHLASWRQLGEEEAACSRIEDLTNLIDAGHAPQIIAGDFNEGPQGTATLFLMSHGYLDAAVLAGRTVDSTGINKSRSDQIWLHESIANRLEGFAFGGWDDLDAQDLNKTYLSDHLPLWVILDY